jgi:prephenate dehydrogenase
MARVSVAILGLGRVGASIGLALKRYNATKDVQHTFEVTYADTRAGVRGDAQKIGLGDKIERDVVGTAINKDIVILAVPYADVQATYKELGREVRSGAVVLDMSLLKRPSLKWAQTYLNPDTHLVGVTPIVNPKYLFDGLDNTEHATEDLFDRGNMLLMPSATCVKEAVELASDFSALLGAKPHFVDPDEHDSLVAITEGLPAIVSLAAFYMMLKSQGWSDIQRFTNPSFGRLTHHLYDNHPDDTRDFLLANRENLVRQIDELTASLQSFRAILAQDDRKALESALIESGKDYDAWINRRFNAKWDEDKTGVKNPSLGGMVMSGLMGTFLTRRVTGEKNGDEDEK